MKICILSRNGRLYSTRRLYEAAEQRGHTALIADPLQCYIQVTSNRPSVHYRRQSLVDFDAVIPRIGASITFYGTAVVRQFEMGGIFSLNESVAISRARDKLRALQILSRKGVGLPTTGFAHSVRNTDDLIDMVGGAPLLVKLLEGTQGRGVVMAETRQAAESVIDAFREMDAHFLVQEFIREAKGTDIRAFVIRNRVVAAMKRTAREGEFRSNLHRGGKAERIELTAEERRVAVRAAKAIGLNVAGVDLLRSARGPLVMEVNASPGLEGIETATGKDVSGMIIQFIERHAKRGNVGTKGSG